ncbi:hypothetical protein CANTEDRAFT_104194 [Yamadazyma tenuis ATCC 10573]|uniref:Condensin complex subunit 1 n=2 Tax=Candida tenuis TaxID=2315449 RepID=G3B182_CANTC|nr:uncharacterized protein CANTEDRAFT_104194 [Yamadazyma tenuis ATCC 10573]EGV64902.1 hypothetical protein CANTEDRAFT_104194 [Yamadazyma tenuis ATCC 10573]
MADFNLTAYFNSFDVEKLSDDRLPDSSNRLESLIENLANNPESLSYNNDLFEDAVELTHGLNGLQLNQRKQLSYLMASSFKSVSSNINLAIQSGDFVESLPNFKTLLEKYGYFLFVLFTILGKEDFSGISVSKAKSKNADQQAWQANQTQVQDLLDAAESCLSIDLSKVFVTTPEKSAFIELFNRPIFHLMETPERMKVAATTTLMFRCICMMVKSHNHGSTVQNSIIQSLTYFIHLPPYMGELLHKLDSEYDYGALTEDVLREVSQIEFNSNDSNGPKAVSEFLVSLSQLSPRLILKQMPSIAQLLDNSNQTLRCSVVESCGNIVVDIIKSTETSQSSTEQESAHRNENGTHQTESLIDLLQERLLDQNPYVRTKAIQALNKICSLPVKFTRRRQIIMALTVRSLEDRSTLVRRNAVKLMSKLVLNHPFASIHGTQLSLSKWQKRCDEANEALKQYLPLIPEPEKDNEDREEPDNNSKDDDMEIDNNEDSDSQDSDAREQLNTSMREQEGNLPNAEILVKTKLTAQYYEDAVDFITVVHKGTELVSNLLFSKNRNEVLESMDFLVLADAFGIDNASYGIKRMLHLVWMKGSSDEGKSIASHLIDCYKELFLTVPDNISSTQKGSLVAKNLIGITLTSTLADLASFEKLLCNMYFEKLISDEVISILWQIYGHKTDDLSEEHLESSHSQRRGAIIVLGMLALADYQVVLRGLDLLLNIGLNVEGYEDSELYKYSCIALQRIVPTLSKSKDTTFYKVEREEEIIEKLGNVLTTEYEDPSWYSVAEQAISSIFRISNSPDTVCTEIINRRSVSLFANGNPSTQVHSLAQLLFIVGHVAIKTIVYLEKLETFFKKKKQDKEVKGSKADNDDDNEENELEMIGGTTEDDFADAVIYIKEKEILYGETSLLARFAPIVKEICSNNKSYDSTILQRSASLCMVKLMCISSKFCEESLPLLITIMERSPDPIVRSNCVLGLGDMAVCFNNLVDENTDFLYRRLTDENIMVQRTCLMTVTFLILAGQVKVKGQLSSMAKCLENEDQGISDMCRLFFTELATKDNAIYNGFIDIFSGLSNDATLEKESMKRIVKFLVSFIEKEKHQKQLSEKLLVRLNKTQSADQWNDVAFVLSSIPYKNESITKALEDGFKLVEAGGR